MNFQIPHKKTIKYFNLFKINIKKQNTTKISTKQLPFRNNKHTDIKLTFNQIIFINKLFFYLFNTDKYMISSNHSLSNHDLHFSQTFSYTNDDTYTNSKNSSHLESDSQKENQHENVFLTKETTIHESETSKSLVSNSTNTISLFQRIMQETEKEWGILRIKSEVKPQPFSSASDFTSQFFSAQSLPFVSASSSSTSTTCSKRKAEEIKANPQEKRKKMAEKVKQAQQNLINLREENIQMGRKIDHFTHFFRTVHPSTTIPCSEIVPVKLTPPQNLSKKEKEIMLEEKLTEQARKAQKRVVAVMEIVFKEAEEMLNQKQEAIQKSKQLEEKIAQLELENARLLQIVNEQQRTST